MTLGSLYIIIHRIMQCIKHRIMRFKIIREGEELNSSRSKLLLKYKVTPPLKGVDIVIIIHCMIHSIIRCLIIHGGGQVNFRPFGIKIYSGKCRPNMIASWAGPAWTGDHWSAPPGTVAAGPPRLDRGPLASPTWTGDRCTGNRWTALPGLGTTGPLAWIGDY